MITYKDIHTHLFSFAQAMGEWNQAQMSRDALVLQQIGLDLTSEFGVERLADGTFIAAESNRFSEYDDDGNLILPSNL